MDIAICLYIYVYIYICLYVYDCSIVDDIISDYSMICQEALRWLQEAGGWPFKFAS